MQFGPKGPTQIKKRKRKHVTKGNMCRSNSRGPIWPRMKATRPIPKGEGVNRLTQPPTLG